MQRFSKVVALALLLAIVVSVFGILPAFAADAAEPTYGTTVRDTFGVIKGQVNGQPTLTQPKDANNNPYHKLAINGKDATGSSDYTEISFSVSGANRISVNDRMETINNGDGTTTTQVKKGYEKNTDYFVVDFDISTDTTYIDGLYLHTAFYDADWTHGGRWEPSNLYFSLRGEDNDSFKIGVKDVSDAVYAYAPYGEEVWQHVTFVYDFTDSAKVKVYFYINGIYAGAKTTADIKNNGSVVDGALNMSDALALYFIRIYTPTQSVNNASTNFANFTVKRFEVGYDGPFTDARGLGTRGTTLDQLPDLAYCLENAPGGERTKLADVVRADGSDFTAYSVNELDANLKDGDVVTLYKGIKRSLLVPTDATITFKDASGTVITPGTYNEGDLVNMSALTPHDLVNNTIIKRRRFDYAITTGSGTDLGAVMAGSGSYIYTIMGDITASIQNEFSSSYYNVLDLNGYTATLSSTASDARAFAAAANVTVIDGKLVWKGPAADFTMTNSKSALVVFQGVDIEHNAGTFIDGRGGMVIFKDSSIVRNPYLYNETSKKYSTGSLVSIKCNPSHSMGVIIDNTDIDFTRRAPSGYTMQENAYMFLMNGISTGGVCYSNTLNFLTVRNGSNLKMAGNSVIFAKAFASTEGTTTIEKVIDESSIDFEAGTANGTQNIIFTPNAHGIANENYSGIIITDSTVTANHNIVETAVELSFSKTASKVTEDAVVTRINPDTGEEEDVTVKVTYAEKTQTFYVTQYDYDVDIKVVNSEITANNASVTLVGRPSSIHSYVADNFNYNVDVDIEGASKLNNMASVVFRESGREVDMIVNVADGTKLTTKNLLRAGDNGASVVSALVDGTSKIAYTSLGGDYGFIVTSNYDTYTYQLGDDEPVEFYWNKAEGEQFNIDKVVTLAEKTDLYRYEWDINGNAYASKLIKNFTFGVNLTLRQDININIFLPEGVTPDAIELKIDGVAAEYTVFEGKNKIVVPNIDTTKAADVFAITGTVNGAYGDSVAINGEISVLDYIESALAKGTDGDDLLKAVLNYVVTAAEHAGFDLGVEAGEIDAPDYTGAVTPETDSVITKVFMVLDSGFKWVISTTADSATATYTVDGVAQENRAVSVKNGQIVLSLKAEDLLGDVLVTAGNSSVTFNYEWYAEKLGAEKPEMKTLLAAIYAYATEAAAYNAN